MPHGLLTLAGKPFLPDHVEADMLWGDVGSALPGQEVRQTALSHFSLSPVWHLASCLATS